MPRRITFSERWSLPVSRMKTQFQEAVKITWTSARGQVEVITSQSAQMVIAASHGRTESHNLVALQAKRSFTKQTVIVWANGMRSQLIFALSWTI
jgi:hypothetical protein